MKLNEDYPKLHIKGRNFYVLTLFENEIHEKEKKIKPEK